MGYKFDSINFKMTDDNSVGLYDSDVSDIYHSQTGALTEAYDKFINPIINSGFSFNGKISILDICYGSGYNSKAALKTFKNNVVCIDAFEYYDELILLSPFLKDNINDIDLYLFILKKVFKYIEDDLLFKNLIEYINKNDSKKFFNELYDILTDLMSKKGYKYIPHDKINEFLHNIYYNYISNSNLYSFDANKYKEYEIRFFKGDARYNIKSTDNTYDIVFLDAFSPKKDPTLWTLDFLSEVKNKMKNNSVLVSYSKSTPFRSALIELGFSVGKTIINNFDMGTICSLNKNYIINPLNEYDLKIISSKSGIPYRDKDLLLSPNQILSYREDEINLSDRISRTKLSKILNT